MWGLKGGLDFLVGVGANLSAQTLNLAGPSLREAAASSARSGGLEPGFGQRRKTL